MMTIGGAGAIHPIKTEDEDMIEIDKINDRTLYTTAETADILGVSTRSITNYRVAGKLERIKSQDLAFTYTSGASIKSFLLGRQKKQNKQKR